MREVGNGGKWKTVLRALAHRNFLLFFIGQSISLVGTWLQQTAMIWMVYRLSKSAFLLGLVGFAGQIPTFFLAPVAGVVSDSWNRQRILLVTQTLAMVQAFLLAVLTLAGVIAVWHIMALSVFLGVVNAFDITTRQAFMTDMVDRKEDWANAIALNSSMVNGARLVGPSLAGILIALMGEGICFLLNGVSYIAVIVALAAMRVPQRPSRKRPRMLRSLREGFAYAFRFAPIRAILLMLGLVSLVGMPYVVLMPVFASEVLGGGPDTLGLLMGASGLGALGAAIYLASRQSVLGLGRHIALGAAVFALGMIAFSFSRAMLLSVLTLCVSGFAMMVHIAASNTVLQTVVEEDKRGRVMSLYTMAFMGMAPLGSLLAGAMAELIGAPATLRICAAFCLAGAAMFARKLPSLRAMVRPLYVEKGIISEVASGIHSAADLAVPPEQG